MTEPGLQLPLPLHNSWPVGLRLRFRLDADIRPRYHYLRGTPVLVLEPLKFLEAHDRWCQLVMVFGARYAEDRIGWASPESLELHPGQPDDPALQLGDADDIDARVVHPVCWGPDCRF